MEISNSLINSQYLYYGTRREKKTEQGKGDSVLTKTFSSYLGADREVFGDDMDELVSKNQYDYKTSYISSGGKTYTTYFSEKGIFCTRKNTNSDRTTIIWKKEYSDDEQKEKTLDFIKKFPKEDKLLFASKEFFWDDFLNGDIDEKKFDEFYNWTDHGIVNIMKSDDGEITGSFNRNKIHDPMCEYFNDNDFVAFAYTSADITNMQEIQRNAEDLKEYNDELSERISRDVDSGKASQYDPRMLTTKNKYLRFADVNREIKYNGITFRCNFDDDTLEYGDTSDMSKCVRIPLVDGGSLLINLDDLYRLKLATNFFSVDDLQKIQATLAGL